MTHTDFLRTAVVYQISLRSFTREGTFQAAEKMLPHVKSIGVDIVYLSPFMKMDTDMDRSGWSERQIRAGFDTPKNSYRISDYTQVDPEYGTEKDMISFLNTAHALGLRVIFDLVYLHCGPNNVIKDVIPDAFQKNPDGSVKTTRWHFPFVNFDSKAVREYLIRNMLQWVNDGCDGFRCDVGDNVPLDFWAESFARLKKIKPDLLTFNEGSREDALDVFDVNYGWNISFSTRSLILGEKTDIACITVARKGWDNGRSKPKDLVFLENHDIATDDGERRLDRVLPVDAVNAAFVSLFLRPDVPVIYCGNEIADNALMTFFGPVEDPRRANKTVNWACALQTDGARRLALLRQLSEIRHKEVSFQSEAMQYLPTDTKEPVLAYQRGKSALVVVNLSGKTVDFKLESRLGEILVSEGMTVNENLWHAEPYAYLVSK